MMLTRIIGSLSFLAGCLLIHVPAGLSLPRSMSEAPAAQKAVKKNSSNYQVQKVKEWRIAAAQHNPGKSDPAAVTIGGWQLEDLETAISFVTKLTSQPANSLRRTLSKARIRRALDLTDQEAQRGDLNRVLKQGALLHTDIALLGLETYQYQDLREAKGAFADGRILIYPKRHHWEFARRLIDSISLPASKDTVVRQWYIATTAYMQSHRLLGDAGQNLKRALEQFPSDDKILFYAGVLHEIWASPVNQNILLPKEGKVSYGTKEAELKLAQQFFQKAIAANPDFAEAHLRLGRVMGLLGNHRQAVAELQQAAASIKDPQLLYYASLFMGYEFTLMVRRKEAREQYEHAATLYPTAQSPLLALSQLARNTDDTKSALLILQRVFELPRADLWNDDPWWVYDLAHVRDADPLVAEMQRMLGGHPQ